MTYFADKSTAVFPAGLHNENICVECGDRVEKSGVAYDGFVQGGGALVFHAKCAAVVGQRLIADGYIHRRET